MLITSVSVPNASDFGMTFFLSFGSGMSAGTSGAGSLGSERASTWPLTFSCAAATAASMEVLLFVSYLEYCCECAVQKEMEMNIDLETQREARVR